MLSGRLGANEAYGSTSVKTGIGISAGEYHSDSWWHVYMFDFSLVRIGLQCTQYEERIEVLYECCCKHLV